MFGVHMSVGIRGGLGVIRVNLTRGWPGCRRRRLELAGVALAGVPVRQNERKDHQGVSLACALHPGQGGDLGNGWNVDTRRPSTVTAASMK